MIEEKLDLENPIFVVYIDVDGLTNQSARDKFESAKKYLNYSNVTMWYIADKFNKIELIWKGSKYSSDPGTTNLEGLITRVNQIIEIISDTTDNSIIKQRLRDLQLKSILYEQ